MVRKRILYTNKMRRLVRATIIRSRLRYRLWTNWRGAMPSFLIIGAQRSGSTSLFEYLMTHPWLVAPIRKEVKYFDVDYQRGVDWYLAHFPRLSEPFDSTTGEATPHYLYHPYSPRRVHETIPDVRIVALLRNPVDRAYSHYQIEINGGHETLSFEDALDKEDQRLDSDSLAMQRDEHFYSYNHRHYSYRARGRYIEQLRRWDEYFPREQMLILKSEDFYSDPSGVLDRVHDFLDLPAHPLRDNSARHPGKYARTSDQEKSKLSETKQELADYFRPFNEALYERLDADLGWG